MVTNITSLTGNGLKDWLIQRVTAIYFACYIMFLFGFLWAHSPLDFNHWHGLFANSLFKITTTISLLALTLHTWVGVWTVTTDYINCTAWRVSLQLIVLLWLLGQFLWGLMIFWG